MSLVEILNLTIQEKETIKKFKMLMRNDLTLVMHEDASLFYRFLKARDFDIDKAENMLRKHISWRKALNIDTLLLDFNPSEAFVKYIQGSRIGVDKEGCLVRYIPNGKTEMSDIVKCFKANIYMKNFIYCVEKDLADLKQINMETGRNAWKLVFILDLNELRLANVIHPESLKFYLRIAELNQDNYPEILKSIYVINAPAYYVILYSVLRSMLASQVIRKIHVFGRNGWKEELLKVIDADVLPAFLGGNRTDPDGNPMCNTFIHHGGRIPTEYYLLDEDRSFKDKSLVKHITVFPRRRYEEYVNVEETGTVILWEYSVAYKDIGFSIYLKGPDEELQEILPIWYFHTADGTETGSLKCQNAGTYVIVFDNTHSWMNSKDISYCITVKNPENVNISRL